MLGKIVLWVSALAFTGYGIACLLSPELPASNAGLAMTSGDAYAEIGAMYGGLQTGFGLYLLACAVRPSRRRAGLVLLAAVIGPLVLARLYFSFETDWMVGGYTWGALVYESATAILALVALKRR